MLLVDRLTQELEGSADDFGRVGVACEGRVQARPRDVQRHQVTFDMFVLLDKCLQRLSGRGVTYSGKCQLLGHHVTEKYGFSMHTQRVHMERDLRLYFQEITRQRLWKGGQASLPHQ